MKRKFYREVTCPCCEGTGLKKEFWGKNKEDYCYVQEPTEDEIVDADYLGEIYCSNCNGEGYVVNEEDLSTGEKLTVIHIHDIK